MTAPRMRDAHIDQLAAANAAIRERDDRLAQIATILGPHRHGMLGFSEGQLLATLNHAIALAEKRAEAERE